MPRLAQNLPDTTDLARAWLQLVPQQPSPDTPRLAFVPPGHIRLRDFSVPAPTVARLPLSDKPQLHLATPTLSRPTIQASQSYPLRAFTVPTTPYCCPCQAAAQLSRPSPTRLSLPFRISPQRPRCHVASGLPAPTTLVNPTTARPDHARAYSNPTRLRFPICKPTQAEPDFAAQPHA